MGKQITNAERPEKNRTLTYLFMSDVHSLFAYKKGIQLALDTLALTPPGDRRVILGGDIMDMVFAHNKNPDFKANKKNPDYFLAELYKELVWWEEFLKLIFKFVEPHHVYFMEGNHEQRLERPYFLKVLPHKYHKEFDLVAKLNLKSMGIPHLKYNDWLRISASKMPDCLITHGQACGANPTLAHLKMSHTTNIFGHTHEIGVKSDKAIDKTIISYNNPCLCDMDAEYLEGRVNNWSQGFTLIHVDRNHYFINILNIWGDKVFVPGHGTLS